MKISHFKAFLKLKALKIHKIVLRQFCICLLNSSIQAKKSLKLLKFNIL